LLFFAVLQVDYGRVFKKIKAYRMELVYRRFL